jgi:DGQHR domain-containing protein
MPDHSDPIVVQGFLLQDMPRIYVAAISGRWLLNHTTPSWRIDNPTLGFQRIVREERARQIALAVLDQQRTFPNAIVLATDIQEFVMENGEINIPGNVKFLVVDGQHRLWAQKFSECEAKYACMVHTNLSEVEMARLFLEINDNQKRVPPSLRWDLVRLVRPDDDPEAIGAAEMVFQLATNPESPLYQRIDLTGEQPEIQLKQGSIAPSIKLLFSRRSPIYHLSFEQQYQLLIQYFLSIKELNRDSWISGASVFYSARVLRALLRLLSDLIADIGGNAAALSFQSFLPYLRKIDPESLSPEAIRANQGEAGIRAIYKQMHIEVFGQA